MQELLHGGSSLPPCHLPKEGTLSPNGHFVPVTSLKGEPHNTTPGKVGVMLCLHPPVPGQCAFKRHPQARPLHP